MAHEQLMHPGLLGRCKRRLDLHPVSVGPAAQRAIGVEGEEHAAGHARAHVTSSGPEDEDTASGHVLTRVVARPFDDGHGAAVPYTEPLTHASREEREPTRGPIENRVAGDDLSSVVPRAGGRAHDDLATRHALADIVVRLAIEHETHAAGAEGTEALPRRSA